MENIIKPSTTLYLILLVLLTLGYSSCKKDGSGSGAPVITRIRTVSKTDSLIRITQINATTWDTVKIPQTVNFDSTTTTGNKQNLYAIIGENLGSATKLIINDVEVYFNPALVSDHSIIFTIPQNIPTGPTQSNKLTVITLHGSVDYGFTVLTPPPTILKTSNFNFSGGTKLTFSGVSFGSVTSVGLEGTTETATIVSKLDTQLVVTMPTSTVNRARLVFTYASGTATSSQEFVNLDKAYQIFTDDYGSSGWSNGSWGAASISSTYAKSGTNSFKATYGKGGWSANGFANWWPGADYSADYKYLSFWIKGGSKEYTFYLTGDQRAAGYGNSDTSTPIIVPANVWTYYKLPIASLELWKKGTTFKQLGFWIKGPDDQDETLYFDDVIIIK